MESTTIRKPASFRFKPELLDKLKELAKKSNRSLNNYVESILLDAVSNEPNQTTIAAIEEAKAGKSAGEADLSSLEAFVKSCN